MEKEVLLDPLVVRDCLERMVKQEPKDLQEQPVLLVKEENKEQLAHLASRDCLAIQDHLERTESLEKLVQGVKMEFQVHQESRVKTVSQVNEVHQVLQVLQDLEVDLALLDLKVQRALLVLQVLLGVWDHQVCKECQEREEVLEALESRGTRENLVQGVVMVYLVKMAFEVL